VRCRGASALEPVGAVAPVQALEPALLEQALLAVLAHHDALRLSLTQRDAQWHAEHLERAGRRVLWQAQVADWRSLRGAV
jgi:hypothetical protein